METVFGRCHGRFGEEDISMISMIHCNNILQLVSKKIFYEIVE